MGIYEISEKKEFLEDAINYFWNCWGNESNFKFYKDCIVNSLDDKKKLPKFYIVVENHKIIGSYALLVNDIISRQDLMPWFACLYVNEEMRNKKIAEKLLKHAIDQAKQKGYNNLYLSSDLEGFYEKKGWNYFCKGYNVFGESFKIYKKRT